MASRAKITNDLMCTYKKKYGGNRSRVSFRFSNNPGFRASVRVTIGVSLNQTTSCRISTQIVALVVVLAVTLMGGSYLEGVFKGDENEEFREMKAAKVLVWKGSRIIIVLQSVMFCDSSLEKYAFEDHEGI